MRESEEISLQPGDHLPVRFMGVNQDHLEAADSYICHKSMDEMRPDDPLTLLDCFNAFTDRLVHVLFIHMLLQREFVCVYM